MIRAPRPGAIAGMAGDRLLIVLTSLRAEGTPRLALDLCRQWTKGGVSITLLVLFCEPAELADAYNQEGFDIRFAGWPKSGYRRYLKLIIATFRICREKKISATLSMPLGWHLFCAIGARLAGVKTVIAHVGNYADPVADGGDKKLGLLVRLARPLTNRLVCCSTYVCNSAVSAFGISSGHTAVVYNGIALDGFADVAAVRKKRRIGNPVRIGMVGTLESHKDQATLIRAVALLDKAGAVIHLALAGEGARRGELAALIDDLALTDRVEMPGTVKNISRFLSGLDLFVFSTTRFEGQGIALVEAMAAGVPVVASDVGACREVLDGGRCGLLVEAGDARAMADGISTLAADEDRAAALAKAARQRAQDQFDIRQTADNYARLLSLDVETVA